MVQLQGDSILPPKDQIPDYDLIVQASGSIENAMQTVERPKKPARSKDTKETIILKIQKWVEKNQRIPNNSDLSIRKKATELFGTLEDALRASDLESVLTGEILYPSDLIKILQDKYKELGRKPNAKDLGYDLTMKISKQFHSLNKAYKTTEI